MTQNETQPPLNSAPPVAGEATAPAAPETGLKFAESPVHASELPQFAPDGTILPQVVTSMYEPVGPYEDSLEGLEDEEGRQFLAGRKMNDAGQIARPTHEEYHAKAEELFSLATERNKMFGLEPETVDLYEEAKNNFMSARWLAPINRETRELETPDPIDLLKVSQSLLAMARDPRQPDWHDPEMKAISDPLLRTKKRAQILEQSAQRNLERASEILMGVGSFATVAASEFVDNHGVVDPDIDTREVLASAVVDALEETPTVESEVMREIKTGITKPEDLKDEGPEAIVTAIDVDLERSKDASKYIARVVRNALEDLAPTETHTVIA